jgi:murein DD-endopeptidase MepM/ murein hydrolase activator NlpD
VVTTAVVGAGVVALGAGAAFPDAKQNPDALSALGGDLNALLEDRAEASERVSRANREQGGLATSIEQAAPDVWLLPVDDYTVSSVYGWRWGRMHQGVDLAAPHGTPVYAVHAGTVVLSGWHAGYGYAVIIDHGDGTESLYGHNSELLVSQGQEVTAGERIARVGNTGYSFGAHLHLEVHVDGVAQEPVAWLDERGVDVLERYEAVYGTSADG